MLGSCVFLLALPSMAAPGDLPTFAEAWHREVLLGEVGQAALDYRRIYQDQLRGVPLKTRQRAAFRAGSCFEILGEVENARYAYGWLARADGGSQEEILSASAHTGPLEPERLLVSKARARLRRLPEMDPAPLAPRTPVVEASRSVRAAALQWLQDLRQFNSDLDSSRDRLRARLRTSERLQVLVAEARRRLEGSGSVFLKPRETLSGGVGAQAGERLMAEVRRLAELPGLSLGRLANRFYSAALNTAAIDEDEGARKHWELCLVALSQGGEGETLRRHEVVACRQRLQSIPATASAALASRKLLDRHLLEWGETQSQLRERLASARRKVSDRERADFALEHDLFGIVEVVADTSNAVREEREVIELVSQALRYVFVLAQGSIEEEELVPLWRDRVELADEQLSLAVALAERFYEESRWTWQVSAGGPLESAVAGERELKRLLTGTKSDVARGDIASAELKVRTMEIVRTWIPQADPTAGYLGAAQRVLRSRSGTQRAGGG